MQAIQGNCSFRTQRLSCEKIQNENETKAKENKEFDITNNCGMQKVVE